MQTEPLKKRPRQKQMRLQPSLETTILERRTAAQNQANFPTQILAKCLAWTPVALKTRIQAAQKQTRAEMVRVNPMAVQGALKMTP
jgi:hypothetical protein